MKNGINKAVKFFLAVTILFTTVFSLCASAENEKYADKLNSLGLFLGTDKGYELESPLTREQSATMIVRLMGAEAEALSQSDSYAEAFVDVEKNRWSYGYVMYCYENNVTKGTGENSFSPSEKISVEEYVTFVLRTLGYTDTEPETALEKAVEAMIFDSDYMNELKTKSEFTRADTVYISYKMLSAKTSGGKIFADTLAEKGVITASQAKDFDIASNAEDIEDILKSLME